jgi:hypothetical protein
MNRFMNSATLSAGNVDVGHSFGHPLSLGVDQSATIEASSGLELRLACVPGCIGIRSPLRLAALTFGRHRLVLFTGSVAYCCGNSFGHGFGGDSTFGFSFSFCRGLEFHLGSVVCILVCLVLSFDGVLSAGFALLFRFGFSFRCVLPREGLVLCCFPVLLKDPLLDLQ